MKIEDVGIIISITKSKENGVIVKCFSQEHGLLTGFTKYSKNNKQNIVFRSNL